MWLKKKPTEAGSDVEEILECIKGEIVGAKDKEDDVLELTELVDDPEADPELNGDHAALGTSRATPGSESSRLWAPGVFSGSRSEVRPVQDDVRSRFSGNFARGDDMGTAPSAAKSTGRLTSAASDGFRLEDLPDDGFHKSLSGKGVANQDGFQRNHVHAHHGVPTDQGISQSKTSSDKTCNSSGLGAVRPTLECDKAHGCNALDRSGTDRSAEGTSFVDLRSPGDDLQHAMSGDSESSTIVGECSGVRGCCSASDESALAGEHDDLPRGLMGSVRGISVGGRASAAGSSVDSVMGLKGVEDGSSITCSKKVRLGGIGVADDIEHVMRLINSSDFTSVGAGCEDNTREERSAGSVRGAYAVKSAVTGDGGIDAANVAKARPDTLAKDSASNIPDPWEKLVKDAVQSKVCAWLEQNHILENWMEQNLPAVLDKWMKEDSSLQDRVNQHLSEVLRDIIEEKLSKILEKVG